MSGSAAQLEIHFGDNLGVLAAMPPESVDLIYIDPPFNTGRTQRRVTTRAERVAEGEDGDRTGFAGRRYRTVEVDSQEYADSFDDYLAFLEPRLREAHRLLKPDGSLFVHLDHHECHYVKVLLDGIFGRASFINEIVWAYDFGARSTTRWPCKHDVIFWYAKDPANYQFHLEACDRIPYLAPRLVGPVKAARGKYPTDVWWHTIVSPNGHEKTGYPTQKPVAILERIVKVHSRPGDLLLDFFAGSGSFGEAALRHGRRCILVDNNPAALRVLERRFTSFFTRWHNWPAKASDEASPPAAGTDDSSKP